MISKYSLPSLVLASLVFASLPAWGGEDDELNSSGKTIRAVDAGLQPPHLDGVLDDKIWENVEFISGFTQRDPNEGQPALNKTEVAFAFDEEALYVGAHMYFDKPDEIQAYVTRRDNAGNSERIIVSLDTYRDKRTAYSFAVTAGGVRIDYYHPSDRERDREYRYDPVWEARAAILDDGWSAEMKIPFSQLRFNDSEEHVWGVNINRWIPNTNEDLYWILVRKEDTGWSSHFGELVGLRGIGTRRRIEVLPYVTSSGTFTSDVSPDNPFTDGSQFRSRAGADLKMGIGPSLTLDATINPDFGQVEADPAVVNLSAFETFFPERRPFFLAGSQLFDNRGPTYFYSRRIGAPPHGEVEEKFVDIPDESTIFGAAKLTGRLNSGLSIGALAAVTSSEEARGFTPPTDSTDAIESIAQVEPVTAYGVMRMQQEFGADASTVGLMVTGLRRAFSSGDPLSQTLNRQAYGANADWNLRFAGGKYELTGHFGTSYIQGEPLAIVQAQRSSARYFQRPDATHVRVDSSRTSLFGYTGALEFEKNSGEHWLWEAGFSASSPNLELNDTGILFSTDEIGAFGSLIYRETQPGRIFREYSFDLSVYNEWDFEGIRLFSIADFFFNYTLKNFWRGRLHYHYVPDGMSTNLTRGGPLMGRAGDWHVFADLSNNFASRINWGVRASYIRDTLDGWDFDASARLTLKPTSQLEMSFEPEYSRQRNTRQYFAEIDSGRVETYGSRYQFATIDRSTISTQIRLNYAITPDLTLEFYAEPFASSGKWYNFGELLEPRSRDLRVYGTDGTTIERQEDGSYLVTDGVDSFELDNEDFNVRSFRSNFVLRWEWRPGSTFFLVWQQDRSSEQDYGDLVHIRSMFDGLSAPGDNFLAVKLSYWLPIN